MTPTDTALTLFPLPSETVRRLDIYAALLRKWQKTINLVSASTLPQLWTRHIADSLQVQAAVPEAKVWADLGSGGGFPGLVTAIRLAETPGARVHLIESDQRKCAFLREVSRETSVALKGSRPSNLLLFGKPGTGKTAVVKYVIDNFIKKASKMNMNIHVPFINTKFANTAYKVLYEIAGDMQINKAGKEYQVYFTGLSLGEATDRIPEYIKQQRLHVILVLDEIDSLVDKNGDDILYNFTRANERITEGGFISLIGISNSLTFKDKLEPRVK